MEKLPETDFTIEGGWGNHISWLSPEQFEKVITTDTEFALYGHKRKKPKAGDTLLGEFENSFMVFKFTSVSPCGNPKDMFFAKASIIRQHPKPVATKLYDL